MLTGMTQDASLFEAEITPHRSLSTRAMALSLGAFGLVIVASALRFWLIGAWPVAGFALIEIGTGVVLFRLHLRRMRETELVLLSERTLRIVRTDGRGRRDEIVLSPAWLRVRLLESPNAVPRLVLRARGRQWEVARLLGEVEKRDLAAALSAALHRWNHPVFANPQLDIDDPIDAP